jgi:hypothetical protein
MFPANDQLGLRRNASSRLSILCASKIQACLSASLRSGLIAEAQRKISLTL